MSGYRIMIESYKSLVGRGVFTQEEADKKIRLYEFLDTCAAEDINELFDTTAFNEIAKGYLRKALDVCISDGVIDEDQASRIRKEYRSAFEFFTASQV